ncbi:hypothetical protein WOB63_00850 [Vibrio parahaemolyticus]
MTNNKSIKLLTKKEVDDLEVKNDSTTTIVVQSGKGGVGKSVVALCAASAIAHTKQKLNITHVTADVNEGAMRLFTEEYCNTQFPNSTNFTSIAVQDASKKTTTKINSDIKRNLLADERLVEHFKKNNKTLDDNDLNNTFYLKRTENDVETKIDYLIYDIAGGINQIDTDDIAKDSTNAFITVELANDLDSKINALKAIRDMENVNVELTKRFLTEHGYDVSKIPLESFNKAKKEAMRVAKKKKITYTYVYSKNFQGPLNSRDARKTVSELKKLEKEFDIKINFLILPFVQFNELKKRGLSYLTTREEAKEQGHSVGRIKTVEKHPEFQEFLTDLIKSVLGGYTSNKYELLVKGR